MSRRWISNSKRVTAWLEYSTKAHPYGQPPITIEEVFKVGDIVKADADWRRAMKRRGLKDEDIELVQVDPFSAGYFDREVEKGRRLVSAVSYWRKDLKDNGYAHPIEGVVALVDLIENRIVHLVDEPDIIPIPKKSRNYDRASIPQTRKDVKPLDVVQKDGPSFTVEGWKVDWQNWSFRVGWTAREGLVLHQISFRDRERERPIIYRASVTDMIVPYADPTANHFWKCAFDAGEYGLGKLANALELGCDCLGHIHYFDVPVADDYGKPAVMKNAICLHEEDYGILWKHYEFRNETFEVRRSRRLVISFFTTVGNYDYGFFWYFYQDGTIQLEVKLTGIIQTAAIAPGKPYPWGGMVAEDLGGPTHQHFFNARLHMMLDGEGNTVTEHEFRPRPWGTDNPYGNVFDTTTRVLVARARRGPRGRRPDRTLLEDHQSQSKEQRRRPDGLQAAGAQRARDARAGGLLHDLARRLCDQAHLGDALRPRRALRQRRVSEPACRRRRPAEIRCEKSSDRKPGYRSLAQFRGDACLPSRGFSGDAGRICRLHAEAERLLCRESGDGPAARPKQREP